MVKLKLTNREKTLLFVAILFLIAALINYAVIKPQLATLRYYEEQARQYSQKIEDIKAKVDADNPVYNDYRLLRAKTEKLLAPYYPSIIQEKIILFLNVKLISSKLEILSMTFTEPALADINKPEQVKLSEISELDDLVSQFTEDKLTSDKQQETNISKEEEPLKLEKMTAALAFQGSYGQIYNFIKEIELENRSIIIREINLSNNNNKLAGNMVIDFYSIPKPFIQDEDYLKWSITGEYGKDNPF